MGDTCQQRDRGSHRVTRSATVRCVDLHEWMIADFASMRGELFDSVLRLVRAERWHEQNGNGGEAPLPSCCCTSLATKTCRGQRGHPQPRAALRSAQRTSGSPTPGLAWASPSEDRTTTALVSPEAVLHYATDVFDATAAWLSPLGSMALAIEPNTAYRLTHRAGLDADKLPEQRSMWEGKALWWFVQWPVIGLGRHVREEAISLRNQTGLSPF